MYYPLMLDLTHFKCLVVGGGQVAYRKTKSLLAYGGKVTVLSQSFSPLFKDLCIQRIEASFEKKYLEGYQLIIAATNDKVCNDIIGRYCQEVHVLCNVVTNSTLSSFIVPSSVQRGDLVIAVSTGGKSPALAAQIQRELALTYDESFAMYVAKLGKLRESIQEKVADETKRKALLKALLEMSKEELISYELKI